MSVHGEKTGSYDNCVSVRSYPVSRRMGCLRAQPGPSVHDGARSATDPKAAWPNVRSHQLARDAQPTVRDWFICLGHVDHDHQLDRVSIQDPLQPAASMHVFLPIRSSNIAGLTARAPQSEQLPSLSCALYGIPTFRSSLTCKVSLCSF